VVCGNLPFHAENWRESEKTADGAVLPKIARHETTFAKP
jgi:hypothetical protein